MNNKEAIEKLTNLLNAYEYAQKTNTQVMVELNRMEAEALNLAIKALEKDKCSSCKHYDKDYGETCLNPEGTCRVFEYDGYEEAENEHT